MTKKSPIIGDLVEEYREVIRPARGRLPATLWFARQVASLVRPWMWGAVVGGTLGIANLVMTILDPLAPDTPPAMLALLITILGTWTAVGYSAARQRSRVRDGITSGATAAAVTMVLFGTANFLRVTLLLDRIKDRDDWVGLLARFQASGSHDLLQFVAAEYLRGIPMGLAGAALVGAAMGGLGGLVALRRVPPRISVTG